MTPCGLSPRGRGNQDDRRFSSLNLGSIPAWAGEPFDIILLRPSWRVYPRVGGGTCM